MKIKVTYRKLGKEKVWGWAHLGSNHIEIDSSVKGKKHLELLTHEAMHLLQPKLSETDVERISISLTNLLWKEGYRRADLTNDIPLQNGKK